MTKNCLATHMSHVLHAQQKTNKQKKNTKFLVLAHLNILNQLNFLLLFKFEFNRSHANRYTHAT